MFWIRSIVDMRALAAATVAVAAAGAVSVAPPPAPPVSQPATTDAAPTAPDAWPNVEPFWPHYPNRKVTTLTGVWQFGLSMSCDPTVVRYADITTPNATAVPGSFDVAPAGVLGPRVQCAFYRSTHTCTPGALAIVRFSAVNFYARVFVDGSEVGNHTAGGYTPFQFAMPACGTSGAREIAVVVNNQQNGTLSPTFTGVSGVPAQGSPGGGVRRCSEGELLLPWG